MSKKYLPIAAMSLAALGLLALSACGAPSPEQTPPPPMATTTPPTQSPDLLGGPDHESAAAPSGQTAPDADAEAGPQFTPMQPIANPEDMTPDQRHHVYGDRYDHMDQVPTPAVETRDHHRWMARHPGPVYRHHGMAAAAAESDVAASSAISRSDSSVAAASAAAASSDTPANVGGAPDWLSKPEGKTLAALAVLAIAIIVIAAARGSMAGGRPKRRPRATVIGDNTPAVISTPKDEYTY
ncbi:MAG TPA: hypothetical protein VE309_11440 [Caulobacteraceae bacterium]|nr:hypothetical protein [Caulobacteraceae bacterium]